MLHAARELFPTTSGDRVALADGALLLGGFASGPEQALIDAIAVLTAIAPFRNMFTPGGRRMSVAMTNCGTAGWISDRTGYRYDACDPESGQAWPAMPALFRDLATRAAQAAQFYGFDPDACLINRYEPGARLTLHQDRNERDLGAPVVSVSLGVPACFLFGGSMRAARPQRIWLSSGDVVVWGGPSRLRFHGVEPLAAGNHPLTGACRLNLTFRRAL
jgi:alkylated DNA repair protein (DNA oxidative demethylase)